VRWTARGWFPPRWKFAPIPDPLHKIVDDPFGEFTDL
jgi:hypothetical protein